MIVDALRQGAPEQRRRDQWLPAGGLARPPFAHILVGAARVSASAARESAATNGIAAQVGASADVTVFPKIAVRVQGDYRFIRADGGNGNEFRLAVGVVYRFGLL